MGIQFEKKGFINISEYLISDFDQYFLCMDKELAVFHFPLTQSFSSVFQVVADATLIFPLLVAETFAVKANKN